MAGWADVPDYGLSWLEASGPQADIVLSTRIRIARNLQGRAFGPRARGEDREAVLDAVRGRSVKRRIAGEKQGFGACGPRATHAADSPRTPPGFAGFARGRTRITPRPRRRWFCPRRPPFSVMVNEEDHLRVQAVVSGLRLQEAWNLVDRLDEQLGLEIPYAYHHEFGFLTSCPTNVGTGLRASVLVHLPALVLTKEIGKVLQGLSQVGLTFRGLYGEGSEVVGNFFQVSNQTTLGQSEEDLIDHLERMIAQVIQYEQQARQVLLRDAANVTEDKIWRAYGLLRYARSLSFEEMMNLLSGVRLGVSLKLLPGLRVYTLNKIMIFTQAAHLEQAAGRDLPPTECDAHRAAYVRRILATEGVVPPGGDPVES